MESQGSPLLDATGLILQWLQIIQRLHLCKHICITGAYIQRLCQEKNPKKLYPSQPVITRKCQNIFNCAHKHIRTITSQYSAHYVILFCLTFTAWLFLHVSQAIFTPPSLCISARFPFNAPLSHSNKPTSKRSCLITHQGNHTLAGCFMVFFLFYTLSYLFYSDLIVWFFLRLGSGSIIVFLCSNDFFLIPRHSLTL